MKFKDVKILWGRAANRCSFPECRIELTAEGASSTLGDIAHIITKSLDGPRGSSEVQAEQLDDYSNLILLCPTHHKEIDNNPQVWTIEKLKEIKLEHERWISRQLDQGAITFHEIDNSVFIKRRKDELNNFARENIWMTTFFTPLNISEDAIDPLDTNLLEVLNNFSLPEDIYRNARVNNYNTRPNEYGVVNEDLRNVSEGLGHRIQIFRNGHCEFLNCLLSEDDEDIGALPGENTEGIENIRILRYTGIASFFINQINNLKKLWDSCLPFKDMLLSALILNTKHTRLYSGENAIRRPICGALIYSDFQVFNTVINKKAAPSFLSELVLKRFSNYFGLVLDRLYDENQLLMRPKRLR